MINHTRKEKLLKVLYHNSLPHQEQMVSNVKQLKELNWQKESLQHHEAREGELREDLDHKDDEIAELRN